ncbi:MAG: acyltransferase family protein [Inhella sp.]
MPTRLDALDRLRAGAMLAGVAFHAALAHSPMVQPLWLTADRAQAPWLDGLLWPMHLLRMPLFFWLAGFFAAWQWERRGAGGLMRDRVRRVLVPLVVGLPLMHLAMVGFVLLLPRPVPSGDWAVAAVSSVAAVWGCGAVVGAACAWQAPMGRAMRFLADAAYWVYLVHLPILLALQLATMDLDWPRTLKLPLVLGLTLGLSLGTFALWIRNGVWGRWLLGRREAATA